VDITNSLITTWISVAIILIVVGLIKISKKGSPKGMQNVIEAMRRMDWNYVKSQYPMTISESMDALRKLQKK
jgi:F0F1-type ATP synthase membrane subunit a